MKRGCPAGRALWTLYYVSGLPDAFNSNEENRRNWKGKKIADAFGIALQISPLMAIEARQWWRMNRIPWTSSDRGYALRQEVKAVARSRARKAWESDRKWNDGPQGCVHDFLDDSTKATRNRVAFWVKYSYWVQDSEQTELSGKLVFAGESKVIGSW